MYDETFVINHKFPSLNDYIDKCRRNAHMGAQMASAQVYVASCAVYKARIPRATEKVRLECLWIEGDSKRDGDNVDFARKWILDALVRCGVLQNDTRKYISEYRGRVEKGKEYKVIVRLVSDEAQDMFSLQKRV